MNANPLYRSLIFTAWIAGMFTALVASVLLWKHLTANINDPWKSPQLLTLKDKLAGQPKNQPIQAEIRQLDLKFRENFRRRLALEKTGGWLLLGGAATLLFALRGASQLKKTFALPQPKPNPSDIVNHTAARARISLAALAMSLVASGIIVRLSYSSSLPSSDAAWQKWLAPAEQAKSTEATTPLAAFHANWPRFRGWDGSGFAPAFSNVISGVVWSAAISAPGRNSPVVWGNRVFISGGTQARREIFCYDAGTGSLLWDKAVENVPGSPAKVPEIPEDTGYAASSLATDGQRVYAMFATGDLAALNFDGSTAWSKYLGPLKNLYGHATSLAVWGAHLIVQLDQGGSSPAGSKLIAFHGATGQIAWETPRPVPASWATPIVVESAGRAQIVAFGEPWIIGYSEADGKESWRAQLLENEIVPSPIFANGKIIFVSPSSKIGALRTDGAGDITKTHLAWTSDANVPDIASPVTDGTWVFTVTSSGTLTCFDIADGKKNWEKDLGMEVQSSPAILGHRLVILGASGPLVIIAATNEFHEISRIALSDKFVASPSAANGLLYLRGATNLWCLGATSATAANHP